MSISTESKPDWVVGPSTRRATRVALMLALGALVPAIVAGLWHPRSPAWTTTADGDTISWADAQSLVNPLWIDARSRQEFARGHVPMALSLPPSEWDAGIESVLVAWSPERPVVVYCGGSDCGASRVVAQRLQNELGLTGVRVLAGGWHGEKTSQP